jgi:hypothetical protein
MSDMLKRVMRRQSAIRESRDIACILFVVMLPVVYVGVIGVLQSVEMAGTPVTAGGAISALMIIVAAWVALHLLREILRLSRLLKDPQRIMGLNKDVDLVAGLRWSSLLPFTGKRY